jgi:putative two-component system response regulator
MISIKKVTAAVCRKETSNRILIVDNSPGARELLGRWLTDEGYAWDTASSAQEALYEVRRKEYSLVLIECALPGVSGIDLLIGVRRDQPDLAVIMMSGCMDRQTALLALEMGAHACLFKPLKRDEVLIGIAASLERRRAEKEKRAYQLWLEEEVKAHRKDLRSREEEVALRLVWAAEYRDDATGGHIRRIGAYAAILAEGLGWRSREIEDLRLAATMHDIGKIGIPDSILLKPGRLIASEFEMLKRHTEIGARILADSQLPVLRLAREIALCHHERWDGEGYPRGLRGAAIPLEARIVTVADSYDALVCERVYSPAVAESEAVRIMTRERARQFDPKVFDVFLQVLPALRSARLKADNALTAIA